MNTATLAPLAPSPRTLTLRHSARWDRLVERQLQNTEMQALLHQIARELRIITHDPDASSTSRAAAERALALIGEAHTVEIRDVHRDEQEGHELALVDRELAAFRKPHTWRPGEDA